MKAGWKTLIAIIFLLAVSVGFFLPGLGQNKIPYAGDFTGSDLTELNLPLRFMAAESWRNGQIPLWTDLLANGFPLLAEGQAGVFYPPNFLIFTFLPFTLAVNLSFILNFFLAGLFTYLYCRVLKLSRAASVFAALGFSFSGFFIFRLKHLNLINVAAWLPLSWYLIEKYFVVKRKFLIIIALSLVFAVQFFAGFPPVAYIAALISWFYFILKIFLSQAADHFSWFKKITVTAVFWLTVGVLTFGISAIQFFPTYELSKNSTRSLEWDYQNNVAFGFSSDRFLTFLYPYWLGNPATDSYELSLNHPAIFWETNFYFGLLPLLLAFWAGVFNFRRRPIIKNFLILLAVCLFFIIGNLNPLFTFVWSHLPGLKLFRFPARFIMPLVLILAVLAGLGFDFLFSKIKKFFSSRPKFSQSKIFLPGLKFITILLVLVDLFLVGFNYVGLMPAEYFSPPASAQFLKSDNDIFRIWSYNWGQSWGAVNKLSTGWLNNLDLYLDERQLLPPSLNAFYHLATADDRAWGEGGQLDKSEAYFWQILNSQLVSDNQLKVTEFSSIALKLLGLENVKYLLSFSNLKGDGLVLKKEIKTNFLPALKIYSNPYFLPRAFAVFSAQTLTDDNQVLKNLFDSSFDPAKKIILSGPVQNFNPTNNPSATGQVKIIKWSPQEIQTEADLSRPGLIFFSQTFYPGWFALVDGQKQNILKADYIFSAVPVGAGQHQVILRFAPPLFILGRNITLITLSLIIIFVVGQWLIFRPKPEVTK